MELKIGCTGWSYNGWMGTFYPKNLERNKLLDYYSRFFDITEINSTFYKIPSIHTTKNWFRQTPPNFKFTAKFPKIITHEKRLRNCEGQINEFLNSIFPLGTKLISLVLQLPPSLSFETAKPRIKEMLEYLPERYLYPIDARHESWFSKDAIKYLEDNNLCLVWNEVKGVRNPCPLTSNFVYVRLIGDRNAIPEERFGIIHIDKAKTISRWARRINAISDRVGFAIIMLNNHFEGFAPETANKLRKTFGLEQIMWDAKKQQNMMDFI